MRILHVIDSLTTGGAERLLVNTINGLTSFDHHVLIIGDQRELAAELATGVKFQAIGLKSKKDLPRAIRFIKTYINRNKIGLVHSHLAMANMVARLATPASVPLFNSLHSQNGVRLFSKKWSLPTLLEKYTYRSRHHLIAVSEGVLEDYRKYIGVKGPATVLHNFVSDEFFAPAPHYWHAGQPLRLVSVGTLKPAKNYEYLLEACKGLPSGCSLDIYGDGPLRDKLQQKIDRDAVPVRLMGNHGSVANLLREYDVFVMSSSVEGHPVALVEAMAAGLPAIMSDIPVLREATGGKGLYFSLHNVNEFCGIVKAIQESRIAINEYAAYNHQYAAQTSRKELYLQKLISLYRNALSDQH